MKKLVLIAALVLMIPAVSFASGFGYYEHGTRAVGMAGAYTGVADTVSTIYYNPAGIAFLEGTHIEIGIHPVSPGFKSQLGGVETEASDDWILPATGYVSHRLTDNIAIGVGVFAPYGLEVDWPSNWIGSAIVKRVYMATIFVRPTVAFKVNDQLAISASLDYVYSKLELEQQQTQSIPGLPFSAAIEAGIEGDGTGYGFTLAALYKPSDKFSLGVKYQHEVEIDYEGDVTFNVTNSGFAPLDAAVHAISVNQGVETTITMPFEFVVGASFRPTEQLLLAADVQYTGWSSYETLVVDFEHGVLGIESSGDWDDTWMIRLGAEYLLNREWAVRAGYIRDTTPIPAENLHPLLPDSDRHEITAGFGYDSRKACCWGGWNIDFAMQYLVFDDRTSEDPVFPADYNDNTALIIGASVGIHF